MSQLKVNSILPISGVPTGGGGGHNHGASGSFSGSSGSVNILVPYISLNFIIKT